MKIEVEITGEHLVSAMRKMQLKENQGRSSSICPTALALNEKLAKNWVAHVGFLDTFFINDVTGEVICFPIGEDIIEFEQMFDDWVLNGNQHDDVFRRNVFTIELPDTLLGLFLPDKMSVSEEKNDG